MKGMQIASQYLRDEPLAEYLFVLFYDNMINGSITEGMLASVKMDNCLSFKLPHRRLLHVEPTAYIIIPTLVARLFRNCTANYHVVIIDDHSIDDTWSVAKALSKLYAPRLHITRRIDD